MFRHGHLLIGILAFLVTAFVINLVLDTVNMSFDGNPLPTPPICVAFRA